MKRVVVFIISFIFLFSPFTPSTKINFLYADKTKQKSSSKSEKIVKVKWKKIKGIFERTHKLSSEELAKTYDPITPDELRGTISVLARGKVPGYGEKINFWVSGGLGSGALQILDNVYLNIIFDRGSEDCHQLDVSLETREETLEYSFVTFSNEKNAEERWWKAYNYYKSLYGQEGVKVELIYDKSWIMKINFEHMTITEIAQKLARIGRHASEYMSRLALEEGDYVKVYKNTVDIKGRIYDVAAVVVHVYSAERTGEDVYDVLVVTVDKTTGKLWHTIINLRPPEGYKLADLAIWPLRKVRKIKDAEGQIWEGQTFGITMLIQNDMGDAYAYTALLVADPTKAGADREQKGVMLRPVKVIRVPPSVALRG